MKSNLVVRNFGPLKEVSLDLRNVNVFIGPQATGKSALAKIFTILKAPRKFFYSDSDTETNKIIIDNEKASKQFGSVLAEYNIESFLNSNTEIEFSSELHTISYKGGKLTYDPKIFNRIKDLDLLFEDLELNRDQIISFFLELSEKFVFFDIRSHKLLFPDSKTLNDLDVNSFSNATENQLREILEIIREIEIHLSTKTAIYIPAERNLSNIIKKSALNLIVNKVPIPTHILSFGAELEKISLNEIDLNFIQKELKYKNIDGDDKIYIGDNKSISLHESASGIQSVVPLLASVINQTTVYHRSFVIEEPELNLFPLAQYNLAMFLESRRNDPFHKWEDAGTIHTYTTHSPYILSSLNNFLYAYKVRKAIINKMGAEKDGHKIAKEMVNKVVSAEINPEHFTAYQICGGFAKSIFNSEAGLIEENYIDESTDEINDDFEKLMELAK